MLTVTCRCFPFDRTIFSHQPIPWWSSTWCSRISGRRMTVVWHHVDLPVRPVLLLATSIDKFGHRKLQRITKGGLRCTWSPSLTYSCHIARLTWMCCGVYRLFISMRWINYTGHMYSISPWQCHNYAEKCVPFCGKKIATYDITIPTFIYYTRRIENGGNVIRPG